MNYLKVNKPLVSIGVPVYNGEDSVAKTVASLLAQDYPNFELLISDNASTDRTAEICEELTRRSPRIRFYRQKENIGMFENFNHLFRLARGEFFMWSGAHDLWDSHFVSTCVEELIGNPSLVLCSGIYHEIDAQGNFVKILPAHIDTRGEKASRRFLRVASRPVVCYFAPYSLMRSEALARTKLFRDKYASDAILTFELSLLGEFNFVPTVKTYIRTSLRSITAYENVIRLIGAKQANTLNGWFMMRFSILQATLEILRVISHSDISLQEKMTLMFRTLFYAKKNILKELTIDWLPASRFLRYAIKSRFNTP